MIRNEKSCSVPPQLFFTNRKGVYMASRRRVNGRIANGKRLISTIVGALVLIAAIVTYLEQEYLVPDEDTRWQGSTSAVSENEAEVYFFDVGQGDCTLIRIGEYTMLIDASISSEADSIIDNLDVLGVQELDAVVATHPHADHIGGMMRVIEEYPIDVFYMPILPDADTPTTRTYENMLDALDENSVTVMAITDETDISAPNGARFEVLSPYQRDEWDDLNNYSAVIRFTYGEVSFMLTGDAEKEVEERILMDNGDISADILKCGHHGSSSSTSPEFLAAVDPTVAIISCGEDNDYGHPHRETMSSLNEQDCDIYQTWQDGSVLVLTDGTGYSVNRWNAEDPASAA